MYSTGDAPELVAGTCGSPVRAFLARTHLPVIVIRGDAVYANFAERLMSVAQRVYLVFSTMPALFVVPTDPAAVLNGRLGLQPHHHSSGLRHRNPGKRAKSLSLECSSH